VLLGELLDALPPERRYAARMVASAMAMAAREAQAGDAPLLACLALFAPIYGAAAVATAGDTPVAALRALNARLARDIRAGPFDDEAARKLRTLLLEQVKARLRVSNPRHLAAAGLT